MGYVFTQIEKNKKAKQLLGFYDSNQKDLVSVIFRFVRTFYGYPDIIGLIFR